MAKWLFGRKNKINLCYIKAFFYQFLSPISVHAFGFFRGEQLWSDRIWSK